MCRYYFPVNESYGECLLSEKDCSCGGNENNCDGYEPEEGYEPDEDDTDTYDITDSEIAEEIERRER